MVQLGFFKIVKFLDEGKDSQGYQTRVLAESCMVQEWQCILFLPPYLRKVSSSIDVGSTVFGVADSVIGKGCALYSEDADFSYFWNADVTINKTLTVEEAVKMNDTLDVVKDLTVSTGNVKANIGDVKATTVSLKLHVHPFTGVANVEGTAGAPPTALPVVAGGTATGTTNPPSA